MHLNKYTQLVDNIARQIIDSKKYTDALSAVKENIDHIRININGDFSSCLEDNDLDDQYIQGISGIGYFGEIDSFENIALTKIALDVDEQRRLLNFRKKLKHYDPKEDLIFKLNPGRKKNGSRVKQLEMRDDYELIKIDHQNYDFTRNTYKYGRYNLHFDQILPPELLSRTFLDFNLKDHNVFARISPHRKNEAIPLNERVQRPPNPNVFADKIYIPKGNKDSSIYTADFSRNGVERLEVQIKRNSKGNLAVLIEELPSSDSKFFISRTIHCDTDAIDGTDLSNVKLNHLDFAINLYENDSAINRKNSHLGTNQRVKATQRLHFFRIEDIPFKYLMEYAKILMKSEELTQEWIDNQFQLS